MSASPYAFTLKDLSYQVADTCILSNVNITIAKGRVVGVLGPNGAGKTTLLKLMSGQLAAAQHVLCYGIPLASLSLKQRAKRIAVVNQLHEAVSELSLKQIVAMGLLPHLSLLSYPSIQEKQAITHALTQVGLVAKQEQCFSSLSGGEQQRALIAQALVQKASILILDEPINHLDVYYQHQILHLLVELARTQQITVVMSLHDINLAARYCDDIALMHKGTISAFGPPNEALQASLIESVFNIPCRINTQNDSDTLNVHFMPNFQQQVAE